PPRPPNHLLPILSPPVLPVSSRQSWSLSSATQTGCGDIIKKPKLDQHRTRCHSGFDCIDCSTTFHTPAEYKTHTQCISEAEKYQKSLYKGPKTQVGPGPNSAWGAVGTATEPAAAEPDLG
ncbi:hypothetical protein BDV98DRAFT_524733, partial [Pterulicium gracile]